MKRVITILIAGCITVLMLTGAATDECEGKGPGTSDYNARHHIDPSQQAMPNPDPAPERRGPGRPPSGKYVTFTVAADRSMGSIIINYTIGGSPHTFHMTGVKHWGSIVDVGTPVAVIAAPDEVKKSDGTFKHGLVTVTIKREPANQAEGGPIICQDSNKPGLTGGAQCAGLV